ncbi:MAG: hypothetical protein J6V06_05695 [Clostridia bacterium]|nr:hypothetical protein [Clostridia bacterium]
MKRIISLVIIALVIVGCFTACSSQGYPIAADDIKFSEGEYAYCLSITKDKDTAMELCKTYAAARKLMANEGISLSANYKRVVAEETESKWNLFSAYYESIGVTKQDITSVLTYEYAKKELLDFYYGENGKDKVSDKKIRSEFDKTYVGFKAIEASYTKLSDMGESVELSADEKQKIKNSFTSMAKSINNGSMTIDDANESYNESIGLIVTQTLDTVLTKQGDVIYKDEFFSQVQKLSEGEATVIESGNSIYLLQRQNITNEEDGFVFLYKAEILEKLKMPAIEKKLASLVEDMQIKVNKRLLQDTAERVINEYHKRNRTRSCSFYVI